MKDEVVIFYIDGREVTAAFCPEKNTGILEQLKKILFSSDRTFAYSQKMCYRIPGDSTNAPRQGNPFPVKTPFQERNERTE